jgi:hypothetical protein
MDNETTREAVITVTIRDPGNRWDVSLDLVSGDQGLLMELAALVAAAADDPDDVEVRAETGA